MSVAKVQESVLRANVLLSSDMQLGQLWNKHQISHQKVVRTASQMIGPCVIDCLRNFFTINLKVMKDLSSLVFFFFCLSSCANFMEWDGYEFPRYVKCLLLKTFYV